MTRPRHRLLASRRSPAVAAITLASFLGTMIPSYSARADDSSGARPTSGGNDVGLAIPELGSTAFTSSTTPSVDPSTGDLTTAYAFQLPPVRGGAQPSLALQYSSSSGDGDAGIGWSLALPSIERTSAGGTNVPTYEDPKGTDPKDPAKHLTEDRFTFGGSPIVPMCVVSQGACAGADGAYARLPKWADGWMLFRKETDDGAARFFWSPAHDQWTVETKGGETMQFGDLHLGAEQNGAVRVRLGDQAVAIHRWRLTRIHDGRMNASGEPLNPTLFYWSAGDDVLADVYAMPAAGGSASDLPAYGVHVRLHWEELPYLHAGTIMPAHKVPNSRLKDVVVTAAGKGAGKRSMVRRYHLAYGASPLELAYDGHHSFLGSITLEGRCTQSSNDDPSMPGALVEDSNGEVPQPPKTCPTLPPTTFDYTRAFVAGSPEPTMFSRNVLIAGTGKDRTDVSVGDMDGDGLPDIYTSATDSCRLYLNRGNGVLRELPSQTEGFQGGFSGDWTSNGRLGVLQWGPVEQVDPDSPPLGSTRLGTAYEHIVGPHGFGSLFAYALKQTWRHGAVIPEYIDGLDVNGDGLTDIVERSLLHKMPKYTYEEKTHLATKVGDASIRPFGGGDSHNTCIYDMGQGKWGSDFADMDGDGLVDEVRTDAREVSYKAGLGNGTFGNSEDCLNTFSWMSISNAPALDWQTTSSYYHDVNGDGLADLIFVTDGLIRVAMNRNGHAFDTPFPLKTSSLGAWIRKGTTITFADMNGSGTDDIVFITDRVIAYFELQAMAARPFLLVSMANGYGGFTSIDYDSTAALDVKSQPPWTSHLPQNRHVVTKITTSNGRTGTEAVSSSTLYQYRDPVYDGRDRAFRGFSEVATYANSNTAAEVMTRTTFLQAACKTGGEPACSGAVQNPYGALHGLPILVEVMRAYGQKLSTTHNEYAIKRLATGLDGRSVVSVSLDRSDVWLSDPSLIPTFTQAVWQDTRTDGSTPAWVKSRVINVPSTPGAEKLLRTRTVDDNGNETEVVDYGREGVDDVVVAATEWKQTDTTGQNPWTWRAWRSSVWGRTRDRIAIGHARTVEYAYDANGGLLDVTSSLTSDDASLLLRDTSRANAGQPPSASKPGTTIRQHMDRDAYGNVAKIVGPLDEQEDLLYDDAYAQFSSVHSRRVGRADTGYRTLDSISSYDRGLGQEVQGCDPRGACSSTTYDGFGRLSAESKPDATVPGMSVPSLTIDYAMADNRTQRVHMTQRMDVAGATLHEAYRWYDGLGRSLAVADQADDARKAWTVRGLSDWDISGRLVKRYVAKEWSGDPLTSRPVPANDPFVELSYENFNRVEYVRGLDGKTKISRKVYHALSTDAQDANQLAGGSTYSTTTIDGHGRVTSSVQRVKDATGAIDEITTARAYLPTGEVRKIARRHSRDASTFERTFDYDSIGRLIAGTEPNTGTSRYAYDDAGRLVGTSDARGCGRNLAYDAADRLVYEDFSPCTATQPEYSAPNAATGVGTEAFYQYDVPEADQLSDAGKPLLATYWLGQLVSVKDRASHTRYSYDARGRGVAVARRLTRQWSNAPVTNRYTSTWFRKTVDYDEADRVTTETTGTDVAELLATAAGQTQPSSAVTLRYDVRGAVDNVASSYGTLMLHAMYDVDGSVTSTVLGDRALTTTSYGYTNQATKRVKRVAIERQNPNFWAPPPDGYPLSAGVSEPVLSDTNFEYDSAGNPKVIEDLSPLARGTMWPVGSRAVRQTFDYDDAHRVTHVGYDSAGDTFVDPATPQSVSSQRADKRVASQSFTYDYMGNVTQSDDDASLFYDRSLGAIRQGTGKGPNQLQHAERGGDSLDATYDDAGNMTSLLVVRTGTCMSSNGCVEQFIYTWDEVGRLSCARRIDWTYAALVSERNGGGSQGREHVKLDFAYDANDQRVLSWNSNGTTNAQIFDSLRLEHAHYDGKEYERTALTERVYLTAGGASWGELLYSEDSLPTLSQAKLHVFFNVTDGLGSTAFVIDKETSEVVERRSYQAYGAVESDFRPDRWKGFRETYGFTGKEEDVEVGLTYFGKRYYQSHLGTWISADPLTIHGAGADLNPYAYVRGRVAQSVDPNGLEDAPKESPKESNGGAPPNPAPGQDGSTVGPPVPKEGCQASGGTSTCATGSGDAQREKDDAERQHRADQASFVNQTMGDFRRGGVAAAGVSTAGAAEGGVVGGGGLAFGQGMLASAGTGLLVAGVVYIWGIALPQQIKALYNETHVPVNPSTFHATAEDGGEAATKEEEAAKDAEPSTAGKMEQEVRRNQAPKGVDRVDTARGPYEKDHVHFGKGEKSPALNNDGTWKHNPTNIPRAIQKWLTGHGWKLP